MKFTNALFQLILVVALINDDEVEATSTTGNDKHHDLLYHHGAAHPEHAAVTASASSSLSSSMKNPPPAVHVHPLMPNPNPYQVTYDNGAKSPLIQVRIRKGKGDVPYVHLFEETVDGFTLNHSDDGKYTYLDVDEESGELIDTGLVAGIDDPVPSHIHKDALKISEQKMQEKKKQQQKGSTRKLRGGGNSNNADNRPLGGIKIFQSNEEIHENDVERRAAITSGTLKNLVIPFKFSDHGSRTLPSRSDLDILMNHEGSHELCPTGSVRDVYLQNSFGKLDLQSTVLDWVTIDYTESYCSGGEAALKGTRFHTCIIDALDKVATSTGIDFADFDVDGNGLIDGMTFFHSGYAAEFGEPDVYGTYQNYRIWSHKGALWSQNWRNNGVRVYDYHVNPALWRVAGSSIGHIGVVAHETGHFLGLPDLYDYGDEQYGDGHGLGSYAMMGNSWGFDGSQYHPPNFSAWSKYVLGWVTPRTVSTSGSYSLDQACNNDDIIKIDEGYPSGEYLLIENRQPCGFETTMPQGGLAIFHVDEQANEIRGYPEQDGWPSNGNHYQVALLQADGYYGLERKLNVGDANDVFRAGYVDSIGPDGTMFGLYPNTKAYQGGNIIDTELTIKNISPSSSTMTFDIIIGAEPTSEPTSQPTSEPTSQPTSAPVSSPESYLDYFDFYPYVDSGGNDIGHQGGGIDVVAETCALDPACKGFNSNGWMKHTLRPQNQWYTWTDDASKGFYVKKDDSLVTTMAPTSAPTTPPENSYLNDYEFHPYMDSGGNDIGHQGGGIEIVAERCSNDPNCRGFNSNGWMKHTLRDETDWTRWTDDASKGFYVKKEPESEIDYLEEFNFYPHMDSFGNDIGLFSGSLAYMAEECFTNPTCDGFNSDGWLKHTILDQSEWFYWNSNPQKGIYVRK